MRRASGVVTVARRFNAGSRGSYLIGVALATCEQKLIQSSLTRQGVLAVAGPGFEKPG
jgi:hypothetical protein